MKWPVTFTGGGRIKSIELYYLPAVPANDVQLYVGGYGQYTERL